MKKNPKILLGIQLLKYITVPPLFYFLSHSVVDVFMYSWDISLDNGNGMLCIFEKWI